MAENNEPKIYYNQVFDINPNPTKIALDDESNIRHKQITYSSQINFKIAFLRSVFELNLPANSNNQSYTARSAGHASGQPILHDCLLATTASRLRRRVIF